MIDKIKEIIAKNPKSYAKLIAKDTMLKKWVEDNSLILDSNFSKKIYSAVYNESFICTNNKQKKLKSIHLGLGFCGSTSICLCAKEEVSKKVSLSKSNYTEDKKLEINDKRSNTNLLRYGVINAGQTSLAKENHKKYYSKSIEKEKEEIDLKKIGYNQFSKYVNTHYNFNLLTSFDNYNGIQQKNAYEYEFQCCKCLNIIKKKFYHSRGIRCDICNPIIPNFKSGEENEVFNFIQSLGVAGKQRDKKLINPFELDMIFPDYKIAIEYCGLYWHSENSAGKGRNYHVNKLNLVKNKGWQLITIFSDEWNKKRSIVKTRLQHIFKKSKISIPARKCKIIELNGSISKKFMDQYHLQGNSVAQIHIGLEYNNDIVAVMTFSQGRKALNTSALNLEYELVRFASNGCSIQGGASKLLNYFIKKYSPVKIISYSDCRWSQGHLYKSLGFNAINKPSIGYWYVYQYDERKHRYNFTKQSLIKKGHDPSLTEWQIMQNLGYDKIWDCGQQKWVWEK